MNLRVIINTSKKVLCLAIMLMAWSLNVLAVKTSGTCGTCSWSIANGKLTIKPTYGTTGTMGAEWPKSGTKAEDTYKDLPWYDESYWQTYEGSYCYAVTSVNEVEIADGVKFTNCAYLFYGFRQMTKITFKDAKESTENVKDMGSMFCYCSSLTSIDDLINFETKNVTNMNSMFNGCSKLTSINLSKFNTEKVTSLALMFCACSKLTSLDLSAFRTPSLVSMQELVSNCSSLTKLDIRNFNLERASNPSDPVNATGAMQMITGYESQINTIYLPALGNNAAKKTINTFLSSRKSSNKCVCYCLSGHKQDYSDLSILTSLGSNYPYTIGQYILAGDITDDYTTINPDVANNGSWNFGVGDLRYFRKVKNNWGTIILPWKYTSTSCTIYNPKKLTYAQIIISKNLTSTTATENKPYVFYATKASTTSPAELIFTNTEAKTFSSNTYPTPGQTAASNDGAFILKGSYGNGSNKNLVFDWKTTTGSTKYYYYQNNYFWHATGELTVPRFRAYVTYTGSAALSKALSFFIDDEDDEATGIGEIENGEFKIENSAAYNLSGQRLSAPIKGQINIINGKKVLVK